MPLWRRYLLSGEFILTLSVGFVALFAGALILLFVLLPVMTRQGASELVPDITRMPYSRALALLNLAGLSAEVIDSQFVANQPPLQVITQTPVAGSRVKPGRTIYLVLNRQRAPTLGLPDIIDVNLQQGRYLLDTWGFRMGSISYRSGDAPDLILSASIAGREVKPGDAIPAGSVIDLVVARGGLAVSVEVPDLVGLTLSEATSRLSDAHLVIGKVRYGSDPATTKPGIIYRQSPGPGTDSQVAEGYAVDLYVSGQRNEVDEVGKRNQ